MDKKINQLERRIKIQTIIIAILAISIIYLYTNSTHGDVIQTKGIVIQDESGNPRMVMGFPINNKFRARKDTLNGLVFMNEDGIDRIHLGPHGKLYLGGKYYDRLNAGWSLFFNDANGEERSGYGFSDDDNSVGLGMDYGGENGGEAIYLYAAPNISFLTINADLQHNKGIRDRIVLWHETDKDLSVLKISDSSKDGKILLKAENGKAAIIEFYDSTSNKIKLKY